MEFLAYHTFHTKVCPDRSFSVSKFVASTKSYVHSTKPHFPPSERSFPGPTRLTFLPGTLPRSKLFGKNFTYFFPGKPPNPVGLVKKSGLRNRYKEDYIFKREIADPYLLFEWKEFENCTNCIRYLGYLKGLEDH